MPFNLVLSIRQNRLNYKNNVILKIMDAVVVINNIKRQEKNLTKTTISLYLYNVNTYK